MNLPWIDRQAVYTMAVRVLIVAGGLVSSIVTARWLSPAGRGEYFVVVTLAQMFAQFGNVGLQSSNTYFVARDRSLVGPLVANSLWVSLVIGGAGSALVIACIHATRTSVDSRLWLAALLAPATLFYMLGTNLLVGLQRIDTFNRFQLASNYGVLACLVVAALVGAGATGFVAASAIGWVMVAFWLMRTLRGACGTGRESLRFDPQVFRDGFRYALKAYIATLCGYLVIRSNVFLLNSVSGPAQVGYFSVASQIGDVIGILPQSIALILFPTLIVAREGQFKTMVRHLVVVGALLGAGCLSIYVLAEPFVRLVFGAKFVPAVSVLSWTLPGAFFLGLTAIASQYLAASGFPPSQAGAWVVASIVAAGAGWQLVPVYGAAGSAMAMSLAHLVIFTAIFGLSLLQARQRARTVGLPQIVEQGAFS